ncbi:MAG TPA: glycosyltransferase [Thermomicrobiales bacterium]|nr:glycosyltransferase [Thermomicrobiales bacterium]
MADPPAEGAAGMSFRPVRVLQVDLAQPLPAIPAADPATGRCYGRALALARLHGAPLGLVELALGEDGLCAAAVARRIWAALGAEIAAHLRADGLPPVDGLPPAGLGDGGSPCCLAERARALAAAPLMSVVIATRDRPDQLDACLRALLAVEHPAYEVVVVDNAPRTDGTRALLDRAYAGEPRLRYAREDRPGLSWARNRGIREARGEVIAFTDDDVVVDRHWLAGLAVGFASAEDVACVTGLVLPLELETPAQVWFEEFGGFGKGCARRVFDLGAHRPADPLYPYAAGRFGSGNNMAFRAAALRALGGFDPALGAGALVGGEDLDIFYRLIAGGQRLVYEPAALVHHAHRREYAALRRQLADGGVAGFLTKAVLADPRRALDLARRLPRGLAYALGPRSAKNARKRPGYPRDLALAEWRGMLRGPVAYLRSRRRAARLARCAGSSDAHPAHQVGAETPAVGPLRLLELDLDRPLPDLPAVDPATGRRYSRALALARLHGAPLGLVELTLGEDGLCAAEAARRVWAALGPAITMHLEHDGLPASEALDARGLPPGDTPPSCATERARCLAGAPFVSVVVPTHNRPEQVAACLRSVLASDYPRYEVVVVDNAPASAATADLIRREFGGDARVRYLREDRPGASWARNRGLLAARAEYVAFIDDDVVVDRHWLAALVAGFSRAADVACVTGNILPRELETPAQVWLEERGGFSRGFAPRVFDLAAHRPPRRLYPYCAMVFGSGANMAFRAATLRALGGFDPALDPAGPARGGEDFSAFFEVIARGHRLVYEPAALVWHRHHREDAALRRQMHGWGVGFAAYLTKCLLERPARLPAFAFEAAASLLAFLAGSRRRMGALATTHPADLTRELWRIERRGYLAGPAAYLRGRRHARRIAARYGPQTSDER